MDAVDIAFAGSARQAESIRAREVSSRELVDILLARIERLDPELNAFRVVLAEQARAEADRIDARPPERELPLLGVPVAVKDNLDVAGVVTAHGSGAHGGAARADAELVRRLRAAGAIVIGKTNMPELAIFPFTESATWGATRNPWEPSRTPGGSSGGSGAAVAAGLVGIASASDGGGSIRIPAACCGLFGLKPQRGRVSLSPDAEHWHGLSAAGAVSRSVLDTALFLDVVSGPAAGDAASPQPPPRPYAEAARTDPGKLRIALSFKPTSRARVEPRVRAAVGELAEVLRSLGHSVEEHDPDYGTLEPLFIPLFTRGIHDDARRMAHPHRLERRTRALARAGALVTDGLLQRARRGAIERTRQINELFERHDVLLTPALPAPPDPVGRFEGRSWIPTSRGAAEKVVFTSVWNVTGQPAAAVPTPSSAEGMPLAGQLVGRPEDETTLIALAAQLEREIGWTERRPPVD